MGQCDSTPWQLADGSSVEILNLLDDHSRLLLNSAVYPTVKALDVVQAFTAAADNYGPPAFFLSDNAAVFSGRSRRSKVALELELERLGIEVKHSTPYHPQTCGKVERLHQTLKRYLRRQLPAQSLALQLQLDNFRSHYNQQRPHRAPTASTPASRRRLYHPPPQLTIGSASTRSIPTAVSPSAIGDAYDTSVLALSIATAKSASWSLAPTFASSQPTGSCPDT